MPRMFQIRITTIQATEKDGLVNSLKLKPAMQTSHTMITVTKSWNVKVCSSYIHTALNFLTSTEKPKLIPDNCMQVDSPDMVGTTTFSSKAESTEAVAYLCFVQ